MNPGTAHVLATSSLGVASMVHGAVADPLVAALRGTVPTLVYSVTDMASVLSTLESATGLGLSPIDGRGDVEEQAFRSALEQAASRRQPVVVLLGVELGDSARSVLDAFLHSDAPRPLLIGLTPALPPSRRMESLFPLRLASSRILGRGR